MKYKNLIIALVLYLVSTGISYAVFAFIATPPQGIEPPAPVTEEGGLNIDPSLPKTEVCPLNGAKYTEIERQVWETRRPMAVMIENHEESRPQSGLSESDIVYEAIAEGGITRFMALFYCDAVAKDTLIAPVRSARTYFLDWASEYSDHPLYVHVGGANCSRDEATGGCVSDRRVQALEQIEQYGWGGRLGNDINQFSVGYPTFYRDYNRLDHSVATEHTMVSSTEKLWQLAEERGWTNVDSEGEEDWTETFTPWEFQDDAEDKGSVTNIAFDFWEGFKQYDVRWEYDAAANQYKRFNGGEAHLDHNNDQQLTTKNVVIQFTDETGPVDELKHMLYDTTGKGTAIIFQNGEAVEATWTKPKRTSRTVFADKKGQEIEFVRGRIWIEIVSEDTEINY